MFLKISSTRGVMLFGKEWEVGIKDYLTLKPNNSFLKIILGQYTYSFFGLKDSYIRKSLFSSLGLWLGYPSIQIVCGITPLGCRDC